MPRWHFLRFFVSPVLCLFVFLPWGGCSLSSSSRSLMKQQHHLESANWEKLGEGGRILCAFFGRVILYLFFFLEEELWIDAYTTQKRERERERLEMCPSCPLVACLSFGRHFRCPYFFRFLGGRRKKHRRKFCSFLVSQSFSRFCFLCCTKISCACSTHEHNTKRRDEIRTQRVVVRK